MRKRNAFAKLFPSAQIVIGLLFFLQIIRLMTESGFRLSAGATEVVISFTISALVWVIAGLCLLSKTAWGWRTALTLYAVCFVYRGWSLGQNIQIIASTHTHALDRLMYSRLSNAILYLIILLLLIVMRKKLVAEAVTKTQENRPL